MFSSFAVHFLLIISSLQVLALVSNAAGAPQNTTIGFDSPLVSFSPGWSVSTFSETGEEFAFANGENEEVQVVLPLETTALFYQGFKVRGGGLYFVCIDCNSSIGAGQDIVEVDAHDDTENGTQPPETLFSFTNLDPTIQHFLTVVNLEDDRFNHTSQITFDSLIVTVGEADNSTTTTTAASAGGGATSTGGIPVITVTAHTPPSTSFPASATVTDSSSESTTAPSDTATPSSPTASSGSVATTTDPGASSATATSQGTQPSVTGTSGTQPTNVSQPGQTSNPTATGSPGSSPTPSGSATDGSSGAGQSSTGLQNGGPIPISTASASQSESTGVLTGTTTASGGPTASGVATASGGATASGSATVSGSATASGGASTPGGATTSGSATISGGTMTSGGATVSGGATTATTSGGPTASGDPTVPGPSTSGGTTASGGVGQQQPTSGISTGAPGSPSAAPSNKGATTGGVSKTVIVVIAIVASLFVLALLALIVWRLVRNPQPSAASDLEGATGLMSEAAPAASVISGPVGVAPTRPQNPFADTVPPHVPIDESTSEEFLNPTPPRPPPPPLPAKSPLRGSTSTGNSKNTAWINRTPRTPTPE